MRIKQRRCISTRHTNYINTPAADAHCTVDIVTGVFSGEQTMSRSTDYRQAVSVLVRGEGGEKPIMFRTLHAVKIFTSIDAGRDPEKQSIR